LFCCEFIKFIKYQTPNLATQEMIISTHQKLLKN
jgi:hypothetical protein